MKRKKHRRKLAARPAAAVTAAPVKDRRIVPVDERPLRERAAWEYNRALKKLEDARGEWQRFEQVERPAYQHWLAATFGALLTELRDAVQLADQQEALIEEVELEMLLNGHLDPCTAYAAVLERRQNPDADDGFGEADFAEGADDVFAEPPADGSEDFTEAECRELFDDFLRSALGIDPARMDQAKYQQMFAEFQAEMSGQPPPLPPPPPPPAKGRKASAPGRQDTRLKELYRQLVRRLHPDVRADGDAGVSALWHDVQAAYEAGNCDRLETLLALTELQSNTQSSRCSLAQMRGVLAELNRAFQTIRRSIGDAKRDPAWRFSDNPDRAGLEKRMRRRLERDLADERWAVADLKRTIEQWSRPERSASKKRKSSGQPPAGSAANIAVQAEMFPFG